MWLSERTAAHTDSEPEAAAGALVGTVTIGGEHPAVLLGGEYRTLGVAAPQGVAWQPAAGTQVLVVETGDGERFITGVAQGEGKDKVKESLAEGELRLSGKKVSLKLGDELTSSGVVRHQGNVYVKGSVYVTGGMYLNGKPVAVVED